jgi:hypothetical protein
MVVEVSVWSGDLNKPLLLLRIVRDPMKPMKPMKQESWQKATIEREGANAHRLLIRGSCGLLVVLILCLSLSFYRRTWMDMEECGVGT